MMEERDHNVARRRSQGRERRIWPELLFSVVLIALCIGAVYWVLQGAFQLEPSHEETLPDDPVTVIDPPQSSEDTAETSDMDTPWYLALVIAGIRSRRTMRSIWWKFPAARRWTSGSTIR